MQNAWLNQIFHSQIAKEVGGILYRRKTHVGNHCGRKLLVAEAEKRGFIVIETDAYIILIYRPKEFRVLYWPPLQ